MIYSTWPQGIQEIIRQDTCMIHRPFLIFILCFNLAFPLESFAVPAAINPLTEILIQHREIKNGLGSMSLLNKFGKDLADTTLKLINDPKNKAFLNTPDGTELKKHQELLMNYIAIKDHFDKCIKDKKAKRELQDRILQSSFQAMNDLDFNSCQSKSLNSFKSFEQFNRGLVNNMKKMVIPNFTNILSKKILTNTARSLLAFRQKFNPDFMRSGKLSNLELDKIISDVCIKKQDTRRGTTLMTDVCYKMDPIFKRKLHNELVYFSREKSSKDKISPEKAVAGLNQSIERLNSQLSKIEVKKDVGYIYDSANLSDEAAQTKFNNYINQYTHEVTRDAGTLLLTKTMKDKSGSIKRYDTDDVSKDSKTSKFQFDKHNKIDLDDVKKSIIEAEGKIMSQARDTLNIAYRTTMKNDIQKADDDIAEMVKINPFAAGQVLIHQPEYSGIVCDSINKINQEDDKDENYDKYFMIGSAVIGGALILTGVGAVAGAYLMTGSVSAGIAAGTLGGSILGYSALAGTAVELVGLGYNTKRANDHYQEMNQLEAAFLTKNTDAKSIIEARDALVSFKEARLMAALSLAGVGLNLVNVGAVLNIFKSGTATPTELNAVAKILHTIGDTKVALKLKEIIKYMGSSGAAKMDTFLLHLAKASEKNRIKFLELLKNGKLTPEKFKNIIESSLEAARKCS